MALARMTAKDGSRGKRIWRQSLLLDLAAYFAARPGQIVASRTLLEEVWGEVWDRRPVKVAVAILRLRRARGLPADSECLVGRQGHGYGLFPEAALIRGRQTRL